MFTTFYFNSGVPVRAGILSVTVHQKLVWKPYGVSSGYRLGTYHTSQCVVPPYISYRIDVVSYSCERDCNKIERVCF